MMVASHGYDLMFFERRGFLQCLYDNLPDKSRVLHGKNVSHLEETSDGVKVFLTDGTSQKGDIVIGCDGVHSLVRQAMWDAADQICPGLITNKDRKGLSRSITIPITIAITRQRRSLNGLTDNDDCSTNGIVDMPPRYGTSYSWHAERAFCGTQRSLLIPDW